MKKINLFLVTASLLSLPLVAASCNKTDKKPNSTTQGDDSSNKAIKKELRFAVNKPWFGKQDGHNFFKQIIEEYNKKTKQESTIKVTYAGENNDLAGTIAKGTNNIAVITTPLYIKQYKNKHMENIVPILQTATRAFKFDTEDMGQIKYKDGKETDPLRELAKKAHTLFAAKKYTEWKDDEYKWNGSIYEHFYDTNGIVPHYRGVVMIHGDKDTRDKIKKAWEEKDWNTFRNFGIVTSSEDSGSKYILQEQLFKRHFGKDKFESFKKDKLKANAKYISSGKDAKPRNIGQGSIKEYHIVFDDLGSFAHTHNSKDGKPNKFYSPEGNSEIEFLTVTEALRYNVIAVDKKVFNDEEIKVLQDVIINLAKDKKDDYGPTVGFNGYIKINNVENDVIKPYNEIFKN
ncbi:ABC transporter thiamine pyrophosphate-binding lipoprotein p37/Cypl [Metamycoplasma auris]|uniref:Phosphonate transport system substrate-binding protein n=1 Tax=Metamycoplasma auris TaxID=51363 RepID=A0A2W7GRS8_9BACT|nr:variable surface lipoprotein [Metamycoplasma auris]PZV99958.1 phosphonate transport system substrate-binding protein [Metamycoplasma auris]